MLNYFKSWFGKKPIAPKPISPVQQTIKNLDLINPYAFKQVYSSDLSIFMLNVPVSTISKYQHLLEKATEGIKTDVGLFKNEYQLEYSRLSVSDFFLTNNGYYLGDTIETVKSLIIAIRSFLIAYDSLSEDDCSAPTNDHNRRILTGFVKNVIDIVDRFLEIR